MVEMGQMGNKRARSDSTISYDFIVPVFTRFLFLSLNFLALGQLDSKKLW